MDNFQVVRFFEEFANQLAGGTNLSLEQIKEGVPPEIRGLEEFGAIERLTPEQAERPLDPADAAKISRATLRALAADPAIGPVLNSFASSYRDEALVADLILSVGLVATVMLVAATTEFEGKIFGIKFTKGKADPKLIKAILNPFTKALK